MEDITNDENRKIIFDHFLKTKLEILQTYNENNWDQEMLFDDYGDIFLPPGKAYYDENEKELDLDKYKEMVLDNYMKEEETI